MTPPTRILTLLALAAIAVLALAACSGEDEWEVSSELMVARAS